MVSSQHPSRLRAGVATAASAAVVAMAVVAAPAAQAAAPVSYVSDDFSTGTQGWYTWGIPGAADASTGELCAAVPADAGGNPWDGALQVDGVAFKDGAPTTISFTAHATASADLTLQTGGSYPDVVQKSVHVGPDAQSFELDVTPAGWSTDTGSISLQVGANAQPFTLCIDDVVLATDTEVLPSTTFDGTLPDGWSLSDGYTVTSAAGDGDLCFAVPAGTGQYTGLVDNGVPLQQGSRYRLTYTATATPASQVRSLVGEGNEPWATFKDSVDVLNDTPKTVSFEFDAPETLPTDGDAQVGQVALQTGAGAADHGYTLCLTSISLLKLAAGPKPYEPDTGSAVRVNQVGYLPDGPKNATLVSDASAGQQWQLLDGSDAVVATGTATPAGVDPTAGVAVQTIDFSDWSTPGEGYRLKVGDDASDPFTIGADIYQSLRTDALDYFYKVRSGIDIEASIAGAGNARSAGHVASADPSKNPVGTKNKGDLDVPCLTSAQDGASWSYGTWTCPDGYTRDVVGGWYDAGDHGKYVVNGGIAVAQLLSEYERSQQAPTSDHALGDGTLAVPETGNAVPDILDEAKWELDFLLSMQVPVGTGMTYEGQDLDGMVHHKIHDVGWTGLPLDPAADPQARALARPSTAATLNLAAVAAQGARVFAQYEDAFPGYSEKLLAASELAYASAVRVPDLYAPASAGNNGGGAYDDTKVGDEFYWAAAELYLSTHQQQYADAVEASPFQTDQSIWSQSGFSWGSTAALGRLDLATVPNPLPDRAATQASVVAGADAYLAWQHASPFGTSYPGDPDGSYAWGSTSALDNNDVVLATAFDLTGATKYRDAVLESMDYLLGRNALNHSYVTGYGARYTVHQHSRWLESSLTGETPAGSLSGGPNSQSATWDPTIAALYDPTSHPCAPQACYVDDRAAWSVNEVAINWASSLSWVAAFVADQDGGAKAPVAGVPSIVTQPLNQQVQVGRSATLTVAVAGSPTPAVRWQSKGRTASTWADLAGKTGTSLTVTGTVALDGAQYRAVASNAYGSATSDAATLRVQAAPVTTVAPTITAQPRSVTKRVGATATFTVKATGTPAPTIQWQSRAKGSTAWKNVKGATGTTLRVTVKASLSGTHYRAVATNVAGRAVSASAALVVAKAKPHITADPASAKAKVGARVTFTVGVVAYPSAHVQWYVQRPHGRWVRITGATHRSLVVTAATFRSGSHYRAVVTNSYGTATSAAATLTVRR
ncbi:glycoside hydrolase family 9 protein [Cellulomonas alba]|uniref:Glycoside hydrolase family 9 protein n=1 Tax=Cellulomonas alba TaxID=3053467 RepID=A0ABT7SIV9_9CELL|nr:glycoside hydrolase family 9 protein [Cellulomonas alba]MDM7856118.1 glycoside hydrolase family 9 protein [Cellulomonas alba]